MGIQTVGRFIWLRSVVCGGLAAIMLCGCAAPGFARFQAGEPEEAVLSRLGRPTTVFDDRAGGRILEYMTGPFGQTTYFARIGADGRLISYEQVLTMQKFAELKPGAATKADVLRTIGTPSETVFLPLSQLEVWSYPYKENSVSDAMMHVHFDRAGIVQRMMNGPDMRRDPGGRRGL